MGAHILWVSNGSVMPWHWQIRTRNFVIIIATHHFQDQIKHCVYKNRDIFTDSFSKPKQIIGQEIERGKLGIKAMQLERVFKRDGKYRRLCEGFIKLSSEP